MLYLFIGFKPLQAQETQQQTLQTETQAQKITTIWDGATWSQGEPTLASKVVFAANYTTSQNFYAQELEVLPKAKVTFTENAILTIAKQFTVAKTGQLIFEDNAQLYNKGVATPNSSITIKRRTRKIDKFDYTYFCSPVSGQILNKLVDPSFNILDYQNFDANGNQISYDGPRYDKYQYFDSAATPISYYAPYYDRGAWIIVPDPGTNTMDPVGRGYIVRGPQSFRYVGE